ncbi:MAG: hypothetical protein D6770_10610 [Anaerolineae bacterium]|nr:MAG: hypothetical protein D6770_10610 [Anaerolineae bacterium]
MTIPPPSTDHILNIHLTLTRYPILADKIRARMRRELFERGIINQRDFEREVREKAILSQKREGLQDPFAEESPEMWELRLARVRDALTDFYFAYNLPYERFEEIVREVLNERGEAPDMVTFNPELAPQAMLFAQGEAIERMPAGERKHLQARLEEIKVVLIRTMISDHLAYINIAKQWFTVADLKNIYLRKIGHGKIGGKSAGMLLAERILREVAPAEVRECIRTPVSYYLGSDVMYSFMSFNGLMHWADQKYKSEEQIRAEHPRLQREFLAGRFPDEILEKLRELLDEVGKQPLIVRSSSLLEDSFGTSFAGKYDSYFCPNQGTPEENLDALTEAIARVYASGLRPEPLLYRRRMGLLDYDERIAILIQVVEGERFGDYYLPHAAGVAFSRNLYRWSPQIRREDGFVRLVWGLGTRAVERVGNDYPRLVALSHPTLHPADSVETIQRYSQRYVDLIDLKQNAFRTLPVTEVLRGDYPPLRYLAQVNREGYLGEVRTRLVKPEHLIITFEGLLRHTPFADYMRTLLSLLERHYHSPVDTEFTVRVLEPEQPSPRIQITLLQCRPQSHLQDATEGHLPADLPDEDIIFATRGMVPPGVVRDIRYVLFVAPEGYFALPSQAERNKLERAIGRVNAALEGQTFITIGPGRWGTNSPDLGVHITFADIYNTSALIELSGHEIGAAPEPSFGTHFFQDLMEAQVYPLAIYLDDPETLFNRAFFYETPNRLPEHIQSEASVLSCLRLIDVEDYRPGHSLTLILDEAQGRAVAYLERG